MARLLVLITGLFILALPAHADKDELRDMLERAQQYYRQNKPLDALQTLDQASQLVWASVPFSLTQARPLLAAPAAPGQYEARPNTVLKPDEPLVLYMEPIGFKVHQQKGMFHYHLVSDFKLTDAWGRVISQQREFSTFKGAVFSFPNRMPLVVSYNLRGLSAGDYKVETILHDLLGRKSCTLTTSLTIQTITD